LSAWPLLDPSEFQARQEQECALRAAARHHARYQALVARNGGVDVQTQLADDWHQQQQEHAPPAAEEALVRDEFFVDPSNNGQ
jgi:hypothetical protein